MPLAARSLAALVAFVATLSAQTAAPAAPAQVRALFREWTAAQRRVDESAVQLKDAPQASERFRELSTRVRELTAKAKVPQAAFERAFAPMEWQKLDAKNDAALLRAGLSAVARDLQAPTRAAEAGRLFLTAFPDEPQAATIRGSALPMALVATHDIDGARRVLDEALPGAKGVAKSRVLLLRGDVDAADGDRTRALRSYELARKDASPSDLQAIELRLALLGTPAPGFEGAEWIGAPAGSLAALRGRPVVIDFFASWCPPCRKLMSALDELARSKAAEGLQVLGVTRTYDNGYLPADRSQLLSGGKALTDLDAVAYRRELAAFHQNVGLGYPFVLADEADFQRHRVRSVPTVLVLDRAGQVALVSVGASSEPLVRHAVERLLAAGKR